jgi:hypothetical protein
MVNVITLEPKLSDEFLEGRSNTFFDYTEDTLLITEDTDAYTADGDLLFKFRKCRIDPDGCKTLFDNLKGAGIKAGRRPEASGMPVVYKHVRSKTSGKMLHLFTGTVPSGIVGFYDNSSFFGGKNRTHDGKMCRQTAYTAKHMHRFQACVPIFSTIDLIYQELVPDCYDRQLQAIERLDPEFRISDTVFTTVTVNKNFRTALHKDKGDYRDGFGVLVILDDGKGYEGCYTMFPRYGVAVDCRNGDFIAMNVHEWHCNSEMSGEGVRVSLVLCLREKMLKTCSQ